MIAFGYRRGDWPVIADLRRQAFALAAMQAGMVSNIAGTITQTSEQLISLIDNTGKSVGQLPATRITAKGTARGKPAVLHGVFAAMGPRLYQFVVLGPGAGTPAGQVTTFLDSVQIRTRPASAIAAGR